MGPYGAHNSVPCATPSQHQTGSGNNTEFYDARTYLGHVLIELEDQLSCTPAARFRQGNIARPPSNP